MSLAGAMPPRTARGTTVRRLAAGRIAVAPMLALGAITTVAAGLRFVHLGDVPGNPFYDAAIRTMSGSWHAFLFGALDPAGSVSVDKPPVDLWLQVASVKLFGFSPTALKLPQALAGTASVPLVYDIVRRGFGRGAGLAAAAALAVLPVAVLTARSDTMDTAMTFLLVVAAWLTVRAAGTNRLLPLVGAGAVAGLAFNVKLFEALLPLPAIAVLWIAGSAAPWRRRAAGLLAATAVMVVVSLAWVVPVALTPASQRPYPIGSTNGSVWNVVFVFNGIGRLNGRNPDTPDTLPAAAKVSTAVAHVQQQRTRARGSAKGPSRLFARRLGPRIGSELLPALLLGGLAALLGGLAIVRAGGFETSRRLQVAIGLAAGLWLVLGFVLYSEIGAFHPRYFEALSPAVAIAIGVGVWSLARGGRLRALLTIAVLAVSAYYVVRLGGRATPVRHYAWLPALVAGGLVAALALRPPRRPLVRDLAAWAVVGALLTVPVAVSAAVVHSRASDAERSGAMPNSWPPLLVRYLQARRDGTRYAVGSIAPAKVAPLIVVHPMPVLMLTSYRSRPLISVPELRAKVRAGEIRYFLLGRRCTSALTVHTAACPATARWVIAHSTDVTRATGLGHRGLLYRIRR